MTIRRPQNAENRWWIFLPYLIALIMFAALSAIVVASSQRVLNLSVELAREDAAMLNWWHQQQRARLNDQTGMLAARLTDGSDFQQLVADIGLANYPGYIAWIDGEKQVRGAVNPNAQIGTPADSRFFSFVPAVGRPSSDFWHEGDQPYWMGMAPVSPEKGGGVVVMQTAIDTGTVIELAALTGRDVMFYTFAEQTPLLSSNPTLITDPPRLAPAWMDSVAKGQLPDSILSSNSQGSQVVGMTAFPDFAAISYSGYLALVEAATNITEPIPTSRYWTLVLIALVILLVGAFVVHRMLSHYLADYYQIDHKQRRTVRMKILGVSLLFVVPALLVAGYIVSNTSNLSRTNDLRTAQIAKDILINAFPQTISRVEAFSKADTAQAFTAETSDALAEAVRQAHGLDFAVVDTGESLVQAGDEALSQELLTALQAVNAGETAVVQVGRNVLLAGRQVAGNQTVLAGLRLNKRLQNINENAPVELSLMRQSELIFTTLVEREIETLVLSAEAEESLQTTGQASYSQIIGWNPGNIVAFALPIPDEAQWRLVASQRSVIWSNVVRNYQGYSLALVATGLALIAVVLTTMLNLDRPIRLRSFYTGYLFILPAVAWLVWWQLGPALFAVYLSFHKWSVLSPAKPYVGLHNYSQIMQDDVFWNAMKNTFIYVTQIPVGIAIALALALALNRQLKGIKALRTIYYMPAVTSIVVVSLMWKLLYNKDLGIFNYLLSFVGLGPYGFLQSTTMALPSIMGMAIWLGLGARMILFLAGLQSIPNDFYEAADVDGANSWYKFLHITIPLLAPTTFFVFITSVIGSFQVFGPIYVLTQGGPAGASDVAVHRIYFEAWQNLRFGYASAETVILFAFLFVVTAIQFRYFGRSVSYG